MDHEHHHHHRPEPSAARPAPSAWRLALSATLHCLLGCGTGEVVGMVVATAFGLSNAASVVLTVVLGFIFGFALGLIPLRRAGFGWRRASRQVLVAEGLSIAVMEAVDVLVIMQTPGVMDAHLSSPLFWS